MSYSEGCSASSNDDETESAPMLSIESLKDSNNPKHATYTESLPCPRLTTVSIIATEVSSQDTTVTAISTNHQLILVPSISIIVPIASGNFCHPQL